MFKKKILDKFIKCIIGDMVKYFIIKYRVRNYNINFK